LATGYSLLPKFCVPSISYTAAQRCARLSFAGTRQDHGGHDDAR